MRVDFGIFVWFRLFAPGEWFDGPRRTPSFALSDFAGLMVVSLATALFVGVVMSGIAIAMSLILRDLY